jgi:hypothetical protein
MKINDLGLKPGDKIYELKNVLVVRTDGKTEQCTVSQDITPVPTEPAVITEPAVTAAPAKKRSSSRPKS